MLTSCAQNLFFHPTAYGAVTPLFAGTAPEAADMNGKFLVPLAKVGKSPRLAEHPEEGLKLWRWLEEKTGAQGLGEAA
jgi:retinol dehydrogenase-12